MDKIEEILQQNVRARRKELGLTQAAAAERAGIPLRTYARVEAGETFPELSTLNGIARGLGTTTGQLCSAPQPPTLETALEVVTQAALGSARNSPAATQVPDDTVEGDVAELLRLARGSRSVLETALRAARVYSRELNEAKQRKSSDRTG